MTFAVHDFDIREDRGSRRLLHVIVALLAVTLLWAALAKVDKVTRGDGKIIPSVQVQTIQSLEGGILQRILVREGQVVARGQALMEIDPTLLRSDLNRGEQKRAALRARIARLTAEAEGGELVLPDDLPADAEALVATEAALYGERLAKREADRGVLDSQLRQRAQELGEAQAQLTAAEESLALLGRQIALIEPLVKKRYEPQTTLIELERQRADQSGRRNQARLAIPRLQAAIAEIRSQTAAKTASDRTEALAELNAATAELGELASELPAAQDRVKRTMIRSPVRGIVNRVLLTTLGGVAKPGDALIQVVPLDDTLLVEALIRPEDIAFLRPGQAARVRLTAYNFTRYGSLDAQLVNIGADAIEMPKTGELRYRVQVRTRGALRDADGKALPVIPGMVAEVDILNGKRSVLSYLIEPVIRVKSKAFRE
ncbi:membrane fusion protein, adhesin transport system [Sphingomonas laterariae]|uniref:Membrane fusion protein (MFP) family protein n=1 Tax=Edaphosphingomonas laterariae TaxID=861865 RepID=A0A239HH23_9SPHN|nr:HlyD family type I secretion periplasmic adaptor subunit [Sphingomonas laterariae]SNS80445.1 membrane fusion protein, adhesin transport system [Sphingomonas laterariae]